jgi:hypothetical protein
LYRYESCGESSLKQKGRVKMKGLNKVIASGANEMSEFKTMLSAIKGLDLTRKDYNLTKFSKDGATRFCLNIDNGAVSVKMFNENFVGEWRKVGGRWELIDWWKKEETEIGLIIVRTFYKGRETLGLLNS